MDQSDAPGLPEGDLQTAFLSQRTLIEMMHASRAAASLGGRLQQMLDILMSAPWLGPRNKASIALIEGDALVLAAERNFGEALKECCGRVPLGKCICGRVARTGRPIRTPCLDDRHEIVYAGMGPHGHLCHPILAGNHALGVLNIYLEENQALRPGEEVFVATAAEIIANTVLLAQTQEQYAHAQKMEAVGRLAGGVAHDFNNILTAVRGYSEFLLQSLAPGDLRRDDAKEILDACDRATQLTRQLLAFSRKQVLSPEDVDLNEALSRLAKMLQRLLGEDIALKLDLAADLPPVRIDPGQLEQVVMNLTVNARDAMPDGGTLTIATAAVEGGDGPADAAAGGPSPAGRRVRLTVADDGTGMGAEVRSRLFEPFFTTKEKGTGLGLSMVYGIIAQSGGVITVSSEPGQGATFTILLPACSGGAKPPGSPALGPLEQARRPRRTRRETILLVEDDPKVRALTEKTLKREGYEVLTAANGGDALGLLGRRKAPVHLLLTDVIMPGMNGMELSRRCGELRPGLKTLFFSGYTDDVLAKNGALDPGIELLQKPFGTGVLADRIRRMLDKP